MIYRHEHTYIHMKGRAGSMANFNYEIVKHIATLSEAGGVTKELNLISYNGAPAKYDLRSWREESGEKRLLKGLTMNEDEIAALKEALEGELS